MKTGGRGRADRAMAWLAGAFLCLLAGHAPAQGSGAAPREAVVPLYSNKQPTGSLPSSSINADKPSALFVPVLLNASGQSDSLFTSELTLTNRGGEEGTLHYSYTAHSGGGSGTASDTLAPGQQKIEPDALEYLRRLGMPIPPSGHRLGTLRVEVSDSSKVGVSVRTTTRVSEGRAGLAYAGIAATAGFQQAVYLCGLRQNSQDRSNVAFQNMGTPEEGSITLRTTLFSGDPEVSAGHVLEDRILEPGGFHQYNGILNRAGLDNGYVKVERVEGTAPFYAYGVINDNFNSDGSFVLPVARSSLEGTRGQTLPVIVETEVFTSELMVTNFSDVAKSVTFRFRAEAVRAPDKTATLEWTLQPGQQVIVPDIVEVIRQMGTLGISPSGQTVAGALFATVASGDMSGIVIGARTSASDGGGGHYGVFYHAVPQGETFTASAWVDALQQNQENRSNLALVNTGEVDDSPSVFQLDIYDGETGRLTHTVRGLRVAAKGWRQINAILGKYAPDTTQGYVRIRKIFGNNPFLAYGVVNDGKAPGERSGDGAYLPAREGTHDPETEPMTDREVLEVLYHAAGGPGWRHRTNWLSDAPLSEWFGVETHGGGRVSTLYLSHNGLSGTIPPELGGLAHLQSLFLDDNQLSGTIPADLGGLTRLRLLFLNDNHLSGTIPADLGGLTQLEWLWLHENQLTGAIPPELGGLTQLQKLHLGVNQLTGAIPLELARLTQLESLYLIYNQLTGAIPKQFQQLSKLIALHIAHTGVCVPRDAAFQAWLDALPSFTSSRIVCDGTRRVLFSESSYEVREGETLTVSVRLIDWTEDPAQSTEIALMALPGGGATAADYSGVPERVTITTPANEAVFMLMAVKDDNVDHGETVVLGFGRPLPSGVTAGFPDSATVTIHDAGTERMTDREVLEALYHTAGGPSWKNRTNWLSEVPLFQWHGVGTDSNGRVTRLDLSRNGLSGSIPPALGQLARLEWLDLSHNERLSKAIPPELGRLTQLQGMFLGFNELSGGIPSALAGLTQLQELDLGVNQLTGTIPPDLGGLTRLRLLFFNDNQLSGTIPPDLGGLTQLQQLDLSYNELTGTIPPELGRLKQLQRMFLVFNELSGGIPSALGGLTQLRDLDLRYNQLSGVIPVELGGLTQLQELNLEVNQLSGPIPVELAGMTQLQRLDFSFNQLTGTIPPELNGLTQLQELNLEVNQLSGPIPVELSRLTQLHTMFLGDNELTGTIPPELGGMAQLRDLALRNNQLSGMIPVELSRLTQLRQLDLRRNYLSGGIPPELGGLANLRELELDRNRLTGPIPVELSRLTQLQWLTLDFNLDLTGAIPPGLQQLPIRFLSLVATSVCVPEDAEFQRWLETIERYTPSGLTCGRPADGMSSIDIMIVYTPKARRFVGGTAEMEAKIDLMIAETNQAYLDSGVNQQLVLVAREEVDYAESRRDAFRDLARLRSPSDGYMDEVHAIRDQTGADLVHLLAVNAPSHAELMGPFGLTWVKEDALVFAHEVGHNMGLHHDRDSSPYYSTTLPYSHGYVNQRAFAPGAPTSAQWRTIMALWPSQCYNEGSSCEWILRFSNPNQTYLGDPLGVPGDEWTKALNGPADAVRALNHTRHSVAAFRPRASGNRLTMPASLLQARSTVRAAGQLPVLLPGDGLFQAIGPNEPRAASHQADSVLDPATLRRRQVSIDTATLERLPTSRSTALRLNLFDDIVLTGIIERQTPTFSGGLALSGQLAGVPGGTVTLVVNGSVVAGSVRLPGATYRIRPDSTGRHTILQVDPSLLPQGCIVVKQPPNRR